MSGNTRERVIEELNNHGIEPGIKMSTSLVVLQASDLQQLNFLHQGSTRLKVVCFDLSPSFIVLGANSGTIYVLDHETFHLKKQIPAGYGCVMQLSISADEQQVACALSCGTIMVFKLPQACTQLLTSSMEHRGQMVTTLIWAAGRPELFIGDASGRVTMLYVSKSKTASLFRSSCLHLMTLESSIIQLDYQEGHLLVSTLTHSYVCNTRSETFSQVGTKLRQGEYGGCFCQVNCSGKDSPRREPRTEKGVKDLQASLTSSLDKFGLSDCYEAMEEELTYHSSGLRRERLVGTASPMLMSHVFCARPGTRIWEANYSGKVLVTHQLKNALMVPPAELLVIDGSLGEENVVEEINLLPDTNSPIGGTGDKLTGQEPTRSNNPIKAMHPPVSVAFTKMLSFYNKYLLAISTYGLYIIDPGTSKVLLWVSVSEGITDVKVAGNSLIYKSDSGCIQNLMVTTVDIAILVLHTRKLFLECAALCLKNADALAKSELLSRLGARILRDLNNNITNIIIKEKIQSLKFFAGIDEEKSQSMNLTKKSGVTYIKNQTYETEEIRANLNVALKYNQTVLSDMTVTRWKSEPHLGGSRTEWRQLPSNQDTISIENRPMGYGGKNRPIDTTSTFVHEAPDLASLDTLQSRSSEKYMVNLSSASNRCTLTSGPDHNLENSPAPFCNHCARNSDYISPQRSQESSMEMFEDPLFTPEDSPSPDPETTSRIFMDRHPPTQLPYASHNFYNLAYAPIHPGSEAATILQDLMENVTTNVVDTFTSGTKTLTERLRSVVPAVSAQRGTEGVVIMSGITRNHPDTDSEVLPYVTPLKGTDAKDDVTAAIVIEARSRKKHPQRQPSVPAASGSNQVDLEEIVPHPELPGVIRNLHELVCATMQQMTSTTNPKEAHNVLSHWFEVFCYTIQEIKRDSTHSSLPASEDHVGEGPISLSSFESSHSVGSANTSTDSLHWDSSDIGFEPSSLSVDILEKITGLFLESLQTGVTISNLHLSWIIPQKVDFPQHPMTPSEVRKKDALYAQVIANDCGLLQYSHILNSLESLGHHYYILTWVALMEKITRNNDTLPSQPLPDIIPDLEFTRSQWVSILHSVASSGSTKNLISTAAKIESPIVIQDVIFLLQYIIVYPVEMNCSLSSIQSSKLLLQYLTEFFNHSSLTRAYLDFWCICSELQSDILRALLSETSPVPSHFSCKCGLPLPRRIHVTLQLLEEMMLIHEIVDPRGLAEMCQTLGYWKGYCVINLTYYLQSHTQLFPYILQTCDATLLDEFLDLLHSDDFEMAFSTLAKVTSKDIFSMLCFRCQKNIFFPERKLLIEDRRTGLDHKVLINGNSHSFSNTCLMEASNKKLHDVQIPMQEAAAIDNMSQLWEVVVAKVLRRSGAANTIRLLTNVQDTIPPGIISKRVFNWCILASLAEQRGPSACWTLLDSLCSAKTKLYSHKVLQAIHHRPLQRCHENQANDISFKCLNWNKPFFDTVQNGISPPPTSITPKDPRHPVLLGHHWGVWAEVLEGLCFCCHLRLSTQALVSEGGITVFSCSHAFHTICLSHREYQCVRCAQPQQYVPAQ